MKEEIWSEVKGYEGLYEISSYGNIRSIDRRFKDSIGRNRLIKSTLLKTRKNKNGYIDIVLLKEGRQSSFLIHRLVALNFIINNDNKEQINHKDGNKQNNNICNLEWCTRKENIKHSFDNNLQNVNMGENHANTSLKNEDVVFIFKSDLKRKELSKMFNVSYQSICDIKRGRTWFHITNLISNA